MIFRLSILFFPILLLISSCAPEHSEIVLAEYGNREVKMNEFENAYIKNVGSIEQAKKDSLQKLQNFLDLYVKFKMKLRDAEVRGYDRNSELISELEDYKKKVGVTYLLEKEIVEPGIKELYEKRKKELRVSHIMFRYNEGEEKAKELAQAVLDSIKAGSEFNEMVQKYSEDTFSKPVNGDIYYITAGMLPYEFEEAAYDTPEGEIYPEVVKTQYGYHIIKVTDINDRIPQIQASHILVDLQNEAGEIDSASARARIDSVLVQARGGGDFAQLAEQYSDDAGSKVKGGDLGFFERRMMVKEFDAEAFSLNEGEISDVVKTQFGYHIIKLTGKKEYPTIEEDKETLKKIFKQSRYQEEYNSLISKLKGKYNYSLNDSSLSEIASSSDSAKIGGELEAINNLQEKTIFSYAGKTVKAKEFYEKLVSESEFMNKLITEDLLKNAAEKISGNYLLEEEALNLEKTNEEFASLMDDYKNGIYIFKLQEDEVWNKVEIDSTRLKEHYEATKANYVWPDRVDFSEIYSKKDSLIQEYYGMLENGASFDSVASKYTERPGYKEKAGHFGFVDSKSSQLAMEAEKLKEGEYSSPFQTTGGYSIVKLNSKDPSRIKTFDEARAEVAGSFQEAESKRLEENYIQRLTSTYEPEIDYEKLEQAFKSE